MSVSEQLPTYRSLAHIRLNLLSVDCCWVRGVVGSQLLRY